MFLSDLSEITRPCNKMRWIASTCLLVLVITELSQGTAARKPTMTPAVEELLIQEGDALVIECQGEGRLQFSTQQYLTLVNQSEFSISVNNDSGSYTFTRPNARGVDTGWYACAEEGIDILNDEQTIDRPDKDISWIYVYVNSSSLFAVRSDPGFVEATLVPVVVGERTVIPCRPSLPDLPVTLKDVMISVPHTSLGCGFPREQDNVRLLNHGVIVDSDCEKNNASIDMVYNSLGFHTVTDNSTYDPRLGFVISGIYNDRRGEGAISCQINVTDRTEETLRILLVFYYKQGPVFEQGLVVSRVKGQNLTLDCRGGTRTSQPRLYWKIPESVPSLDRHTYKVHAKGLNKYANWKLWVTQLTITNLGKSDTGEYICFEKEPRYGHVKSVKLILWVSEPAIVTGESVRYVNKSDGVDLSCDVEGYPLTSFTWVKIVDSKEEVYPDEQVRSLRHSLYEATTSIGWKNAARENNGTYECRVVDYNSTISHRTYLVVTEVPEVRIELAKAVGAGSIFIGWTAFDGNKPINPYSVQRRENGTEEWQDTPEKFGGGNSSHLLNGLDASSAYQLRIIATNSIGTSQPAYSDWITTFAEDPQLVPNIWITETSNTSITFEYEVPPAEYQDLFQYLKVRRLDAEVPRDIGQVAISGDLYAGGLETGDEVTIRVAFCSSYTDRCGNWSAEVKTVVMDRDPIFVPDILLVEPTRDSMKISWSKPPAELQDRVHQYKVMATNSDGQGKPSYVDKTENSYVFKNLEPSTIYYRLKVAACSEYKTQCGNWSTEKDGFAVATDDDSGRVKLLAGLMVGLFLLLSLVFAIGMYVRNKHEMASRKKFIKAHLDQHNGVAPDCLDPALNMADQAVAMKYDKKWEFPRKLLNLDKVLGSGAFGIVMKAAARSICRGEPISTVAVKMVRGNHRPDHMAALTRELKILAYLGKHVNIVNLIGACTANIPHGELLVIVEFCRFGNLHDYLRRCRDNFVDRIDAASCSLETDTVVVNDHGNNTVILENNSTTENSCQTEDFEISSVPIEEQASNLDLIKPGQRSKYRGDFDDDDVGSIGTEHLLNWAWQVSRGMKFLGIRRVLHGDLATRNILLADNNVVKICDFGLAKSLVTDDIYKKSGHGPLPVKWMAIESIRDRLFSVKSDVWAFGVVLWELFSLAETPYPGVANDSVYQKLADGYRMAQPKYATEDLYQTMLRCWDAKTSKRPSFGELEDTIADVLDDKVKTHYLAFDAQYAQINAEATAPEVRDPSTVASAVQSELRSKPLSHDIGMMIRKSHIDTRSISPNSSVNQSPDRPN